MAAFSVIGFVDNIKLIDGACLLFVSEFKKGYTKQNGEVVDDKYISWKIIFGEYFRKYLTQHFGRGMLVEVKGDVLPYVIEHGEVRDGLSVIGQTCNLFSFPRSNVKQELRMIKESQEPNGAQPNVEEFQRDDF